VISCFADEGSVIKSEIVNSDKIKKPSKNKEKLYLYLRAIRLVRAIS